MVMAGGSVEEVEVVDVDGPAEDFVDGSADVNASGEVDVSGAPLIPGEVEISGDANIAGEGGAPEERDEEESNPLYGPPPRMSGTAEEWEEWYRRIRGMPSWRTVGLGDIWWWAVTQRRKSWDGVPPEGEPYIRLAVEEEAVGEQGE
jgi:hypothetical protein